MEELAVLIAFAIAIAMAVMMDGCCAGPLTAGAAVKVGPNFFLRYGGALFTVRVDMLKKKKNREGKMSWELDAVEPEVAPARADKADR